MDVLLNQLELSYHPVTSRDFKYMKKNKSFVDILSRSKIYIVAQRPKLIFNNVQYFRMKSTLSFNIVNTQTLETIEIVLPIYQNGLIEEGTPIEIKFGKNFKTIKRTKSGVINDIDSITIYKFINNQRIFDIRLTPDNLFWYINKGGIYAKYKGSIKNYLEFKVHYVGKAIKQNITQRLKGHEKLQDILCAEGSLSINAIPSEEIIILFFHINDSLSASIIKEEFTDEEFEKYYLDIPDSDKIHSDAEKALIKALNPAYNVQKYSNYPNEKDIHKKNTINSISYTLIDKLTLIYEDVNIRGGLYDFGGDSIRVTYKGELDIIKVPDEFINE